MWRVFVCVCVCTCVSVYAHNILRVYYGIYKTLQLFVSNSYRVVKMSPLVHR
jgi:hypothetical protein